MLIAFNARECLDRMADRLPKEFIKPLNGGLSDGWKLDRDESARVRYFAMCGWDDKTVVPKRANLEQQGLAGLRTS